MSKSKGRRLAEWLRNLDNNSKASEDTIADDSISTAKLQTDAVTNPKIADGAIHTANLADANVTFAKLHTDVTITSSTGISGSNDNDTTVPTTAALIDYVGAQIQTKDNSDEITEGSTNLYFTNTRADARITAALIDEDTMSSNSATRIPSQQSVKAYVDTEVAGIVDSAPAALNTLNELAAALGDDANFSTTTSTALGNRLRVDTDSQGLTGTQQANAITNLGITATKAELNYVDGVTSNIQTQLNAKITSSDNITGTAAGLSGTPNITVGTVNSGAITSTGSSQLETLTVKSGTSTSSESILTFENYADTAYLKSKYTNPSSTTETYLAFHTNKAGESNGTVSESMRLSGNNLSVNGTITASGGNSGNWNTAYGWGNHASAGYITSAFIEDKGSYGSDLNSLTAGSDEGWYSWGSSTPTNGPFNYAGVLVLRDNNQNNQLAFGNSSGRLALRRANSGSYGSWVEFWSNANDGSGSGLDADTLDGSHASSFASLSGATFTGIVTIDHNTSNMLHIRPTNGSPWAINIQRDDLGASRVYTHNYSSAGLGWVFEHMPYDYNGGSPGKLWGATNDGSGSGLDADTVDGIQGSNILTLSGTQTITGVKTFSVASGNVFKLNDTDATNATNANIYFYFQANGSNLGYIGYGSNSTNYLYINNPSAPVYLAGSSVLLRGGYEAWGADNDGSGSGLDADTLDGVDSALYFKSYTNNNGGWSQSNRNFSVRTGGNAVGLHMEESDGTFGLQLYGNGVDYGFLASEWGAWDIRKTPSGNMMLNNSTSNIVWHGGNDGSGSGLDADLLDGQDGSYYTSLANNTGQFTTISATSASSRDKIRVYPSSNYAIGMQDNITYGHLNDWAMTFQMNDDTQSDRGFWWGDTGHGLGNGAMSLTTNGRATIATSLSIGQGESITGPNSTTLYVGGNTYINNATYGGISIGESPTNYDGWNTQLNVHGSGHSRVNVKTSSVRMGIYAHDSWHGGAMGHVGTYTNHQISFICNANQRAVLTTAGSFSTTVQGTVWGASNDGSGSGLDADTVDGIEGASFLRSDTGDTSTGLIEFQRGLGIHREDGVYVNPNSKTKAVYWKFAESSQLNSPPGSGTWRHVATIQGWSQHHSSYPSWQMCFGNGAFGVRQSSSNTAWSSWQTVWTSGNDGSGSGLDADTLDGYNLSTGGVNVVLRTQANGYILHQNWIQVGNGTGLYCPNGAYFYNDTTYGWFARSSNSSSGSVRLQTSNGTNRGWFYADSSYNQGFLTSAGGWGLKMDNSGNVTATGNVTAYSDIRLKEDIKPLEGALAKVLQLRGVQYTRKDTKQKEIGVIAQEIENILPEVVHISDATAQEKDKEEYTDIRSVDYGRMVSVLIEAIKEQQAQIEELKEKLK